MIDSKFLDSSVWLEYFFNGACKEIIESDYSLFLSSLSLFEIKKKLLSSGRDKNKISEIIKHIKEGATVIPVTTSIAEQAADISFVHTLATVDAIIYTSAKVNHLVLLTYDKDFSGLPDVEVLSAQ